MIFKMTFKRVGITYGYDSGTDKLFFKIPGSPRYLCASEIGTDFDYAIKWLTTPSFALTHEEAIDFLAASPLGPELLAKKVQR